MGKKKTTVIGSEQEEELKAKKAVQLAQKKLREGKVAKPAEAPVEPVVEAKHHEDKPTEFVDILARQAAAAKMTPAENLTDSTKKTVTKKRSKAYVSAKKVVGSEQLFSISDGLKMLRKVTLSKFDGTVELHINLKKAPAAKISTNLPHAFGKARKVVVATDEVVAQIAAGNIDFDVLVASPSQMGQLVKFAKVLGPKGLMPNPKNGTVSDKPEETAKKLAVDQSLTLKLDKTGPVIHTAIGKMSFSDADLTDNINAILSPISNNLKKIVLKSSISPAVRIQV